MDFRRKEILAFCLRLLVGVLFASAGFIKTASMPAFVLAVKTYDILPQSFVPWFAIYVAFLEISFGMSLAAGFFTKVSSSILSVLLFLFSAAMVIEIIRGDKSACGCFGTGFQEEIGVVSALRDLLLLSITTWISFQKRHIWSIDQLVETRHETGFKPSQSQKSDRSA